MERLSLRNVSKMNLDGSFAVRDISVEIGAAEFFTLLGPSGAGKTALLRMIAGTETVTEGEIMWGEIPAQLMEPQVRPIRLLEADYSLYPYLTVYENIAFRLKIAHFPAPVIRRMVREVAQVTGVLHLHDRLPKALTPMEKLFTAIARLLAHRPKLLLLDEPMGALTPRARELAAERLLRMQKETGIPMICATRDIRQAKAMGGRVLLMSSGRGVQCGRMEELCAQPGDPKVEQILCALSEQGEWAQQSC